jgi:putative oxidoreductase
MAANATSTVTPSPVGTTTFLASAAYPASVNWGLLVLRLIVGTVCVAHGFPKLFGGPSQPVPEPVAKYLGHGFVQAMERGGPAGFVPMAQRLGLPRPLFWSYVVGNAEFLGGILLILGWFSRCAALVLAGNFAVATYTRRSDGLVGGAEFPLTLFGACVALLGTGAGSISVDALQD